MKKYHAYLILFLATLILFIPIIMNPNLILERGNDLELQFIPIVHFIKTQFSIYRQIPLWNNSILSGTPLLSDPQSRLFYLPNVLLYILSIKTGLLISFFLHIFFGGLGIYILSKYALGFSEKASLFSSILYIFSPKLAGFLEAGHFGLIASWAYLPFVLFSLIKLAKTPKFKYSVVLAISMAGLFYTHMVVFMIASIFCVIFLFWYLTDKKNENKRKFLLFFTTGALFAFGLSAISLLPQFLWRSSTTRFLLLQNPDLYPKWTSVFEFTKNVFIPFLNNINEIDTEKWIAIGIVPSFFALYGFLKVSKKYKVLLFLLIISTTIISLNNASPFYFLLLKTDPVVLWRVTTRIWIIIVLCVVLLSGYAFDKLLKQKSRFVYILAIVAILESIFLSFAFLKKPTSILSYAPSEVYGYIKKDPEHFRVFCTTRCLSQKNSVENGLELIEGYSTLSQLNYSKHAWQLTGSYWDYYTLSIPPIGSYKINNPQPDAKSLGEYNTKYVISPYILTDPMFILEEKFDSYLIYKNILFKQRANAPISYYSPNKIVINTKDFTGSQIILSEVYSPGWRAFLNGKEEVAVQETPSSLRAVDIKDDTEFVEFIYDPPGYKWGKFISITTILLLLLISKKKGLF